MVPRCKNGQLDALGIVATGATNQVVAGASTGVVSRLAIAQYPVGAGGYLIYCDDSWRIVTDTWHESVKAAEGQVECEYSGVSRYWTIAVPSNNSLERSRDR